MNKELIKRIVTGFVLSVIIAVVLYFSYNPLVLSIFTAVICSLSVFELYKAAGFNKAYLLLIVTILIGITVSFIRVPHYLNIEIIICPLAIIFFLILMIKQNEFCKFSVKRALFIPSLIVIFQFQAIQEIRLLDYGFYYLIFAILVCCLTDIFAYVFGKTFGKHKLIPAVSPKKTWEGSIGGILSSELIIIILAIILAKVTGLQIHYFRLALYILFLSITSQFGDLSMSVVKRITGIKDYGKLLPGHGGILDRFDSWLITFPLVYIICYFAGFIY